MYRKLDIPGRGKLAHALDEPASDPSVRRAARPDDAEVVGRLLHDFNTEFDDLTPGPTALAERVRELLAGETTILLGSLGGSESHGLVVLRFRPSIWTHGLGATSRRCT